MLKYNRKQVTRNGKPASFAKVWVYTDSSTTNLAQLFNENGTELSNPLMTGSEGWIAFYTLERIQLYYTTSDRPSTDGGISLPIDGETFLAATGTSITAGQPVALIDGFAVPADSQNVLHCGRVIGVAYRSSLVGESAYILRSGRIQNLGWNFSVDKVFIASGYRITNDVDPLNVFNQQIGVVFNPQTLVVQLGEPTIS